MTITSYTHSSVHFIISTSSSSSRSSPPHPPRTNGPPADLSTVTSGSMAFMSEGTALSCNPNLLGGVPITPPSITKTPSKTAKLSLTSTPGEAI